ncbi:MAG: MarR family transcriptional regulator [Oscillospiraceae bacterium]|nr:MarR family transcriptional regulator [Oscillospiraceae bacterium]
MIDRFSTFVGTITQINRCINTIKCREMQPLGLKGSHVMCLFYLQHYSRGLTAAQLSRLAHEDKAAISRALADLEKNELVACGAPTDQKRYRAPLCLTDKGKEVCRKMDELILGAMEVGGRGYSDEEREIFYRVLLQIADNLQNACK